MKADAPGKHVRMEERDYIAAGFWAGCGFLLFTLFAGFIAMALMAVLAIWTGADPSSVTDLDWWLPG